MPAPSSTRKCLLIACRVNREPCASCEIERGAPLASVLTSARRVSSPRAANTAARPPSSARLSRAGDMLLDILELCVPAAFVHAVCLEAPLFRDRLEPRFGNDETGAAGRGFEPEFHERRRLLAVVDGGIDGI